MDIIPNEHNQNVGNAVDQIISECLRTPVILRKILEHISNPELLKLSILDKLWNYEARSVLRKRGNLTAHLKCGEGHSCQQDVAAFAVDLGRMNVVPFSEISIKIWHWDDVGPCPPGAFDLTHLGILNRLSLKHASVELLGRWWEYTHCPGFMVAKHVLQHFSRVFEQMSLNIWGWDERVFIEQVLQNCTFPRLRILKLREKDGTPEERYRNYIKALASRAPILQELHIKDEINLMTNVVEGSSSVVLVLKHAFSAPFDNISENVTSTVRLENIQLFYTGPGFNFERFNRITPAILQASCTTTLRRMCVDAVLAVPLMHYGICLENVTDSEFIINYSALEVTEPRLLRIVKNFDFTRLLPSLNTVKVFSGGFLDHQLPDDVSAFIEQADAVLSEPKPDRAVNIKWLISDDSLLNVASQFLAEMFPSIETLELEARNDGEFSFETVYQHWSHVERLKVKSRRTYSNLDSFFCGIFPEELEELRQKDEEYLTKVNIVPVMPAITCLKNLRNFWLDLGICDGDAESTFSKLSEFIAFKRCPNLAVTLVTNEASVYQEISHMKPYVSVLQVG